LPALAAMEATQLGHLLAQELPRLTITEVDDNFLIRDFKVKPCRFGGDCKQGPAAKCPFLHPGEKGRRDLGRFLYSSTPCPRYSRETRSCPEGDDCPFAHGFLERRFHPSWYSSKISHSFDLEEYLMEEDNLEEFLENLGMLHPDHAGASERYTCIYHLTRITVTDPLSEMIDDPMISHYHAQKRSIPYVCFSFSYSTTVSRNSIWGREN
jgi:hypothetical protein